MTPGPEWERAAFLGDMHFGFAADGSPKHDERALAVAEKFLAWLRPDAIALIGDLVDAEDLGRFHKDPLRKKFLQQELDAAKAWLRRLRRRHPDTPILYRQGNHEERLWRHLCEAPALASLEALSWESLLDLDRLQIHRFGYGEHLELRGFLIEHGHLVRQGSAYSAAGMLRARGRSGISGHTHRLGLHYRTDAGGLKVWAENGCLCRLDPGYVIGAPDWQQGLTLVTWVTGSDLPHVEQVPIYHGRLVYGGRVFEA